MDEFKKLGLSDITLEALKKKGFERPSPIQERTIPILMEGKLDVIGRAQTGTGKTACFALPILENLKKKKLPQALILAPTRELALQVSNEIRSLAGERKVRIVTVYGGASIRDQLSELKKGADIVVGTPGRVIDFMNKKKLDFSEISYAVLDEADEMLNMGFVEDIEEILSQTTKDKKMLLFSATMPAQIIRIAKKFMREYELVTVKDETLATQLIDQVYYDILARDRYAAIKRIIGVTNNFHGLVFCKTKVEVDALANKLINDDFSSAALHGDVSQSQREKILRQFKNRKIKVLIATDVAARGIDVNDLNVVINYSLPQSPETYIHRIGRTGRAGKKGTAITFLMPSEKRKLRFIENLIDQKITKGKLPSVQEILSVKKEQIQSTIEKMLETDKKTEYDEVAKKLMVLNNNPQKIISAILRYAFADDLNSQMYKKIEDISNRKDSSSSRGGRYSKDRSGRRSNSSRGRSRDRNSSRGSYGDRSSSRSGSRDRDSSRGSYGDRSSSRGGSRDRDSSRGSYGDRSSSRSGSRDRNSSRGSYGDRSSSRSGSRDRDSSRGSYGDRSSSRGGSRDRDSSRGRFKRGDNGSSRGRSRDRDSSKRRKSNTNNNRQRY